MAAGHEDHGTDGYKSPPSGFDSLAAGLSGLGKRPPSSAFGWQDDAAELPGAEHSLPGLRQDERLPWLYSAEDELDEAGVDPRRVWAFIMTGLALLVMIVGGVWWNVHRNGAGALQADGSIIAAPSGPIKEAPQDPGGKTFDGTGDSSFAVSQGHVPGATLASGGDQAAQIAAAQTEAADPAPDSVDTAIADPGSPTGGSGVQVGAYSTQLAAENAWARLAKAYDTLAGTAHRVVEGKADIGTVYHLQAVTGSHEAATTLCGRLKASGLNCQVKD